MFSCSPILTKEKKEKYSYCVNADTIWIWIYHQGTCSGFCDEYVLCISATILWNFILEVSNKIHTYGGPIAVLNTQQRPLF